MRLFFIYSFFFLFNSLIFSYWEKVVIDNKRPFNGGVGNKISIGIDKDNESLHIAYKAEYVVDGMSDGLLKYIKFNLNKNQKEQELILDGEEGVLGPDAGDYCCLVLDSLEGVHITYGHLATKEEKRYIYFTTSSFVISRITDVNEKPITIFSSALCIDKDDNLHLLYYYHDDRIGDYFLDYLVKRKNSILWELKDRFCFTTDTWPNEISMDIDDSGRIHFAYSIYSEIYYGIYETKLSTCVVDVIETSISEVVPICVDKEGIPHICYVSTITVCGNLIYGVIYAKKIGTSWEKTPIAVIGSPGTTTFSKNIAIDIDKNIYILAVERLGLTTDLNTPPSQTLPTGKRGVILLVKFSFSSEWQVEVIEESPLESSPLEPFFASPTIKLDTFNNLHVCYYNRDGNLIYAKTDSLTQIPQDEKNKQDNKFFLIIQPSMHYTPSTLIRKKIKELKFQE
ncbi:MAG: hypothetical protein RMJ67_07980 [Elusimicrobiota bacterium]|nr:hypothetical protein [Endomicrobiia bacterium]MDW8166432.1 hypothetical protein [Elusimicrobiota bacterium]